MHHIKCHILTIHYEIRLKFNICFRIAIAANSIESILCEAIKLEYSAFSSFGGNQSSRELNDAERAKLNELIVANKALLAPLDDDITNLVDEDCKFKVTYPKCYIFCICIIWEK